MTAAPSSDPVAPAGPPRPRGSGDRATKPRPSPAARRLGYALSIAANVVLLWLIHRSPGWRELGFLTEETTEVLPWVTAQLGLSTALNAAWLVADPRWFRALGELVGAVVGGVVAARILVVFPFAFDEGGFGWEPWVRFVLWVGVVGSAIGVVANLVLLVRTLPGRHEPGA